MHPIVLAPSAHLRLPAGDTAYMTVGDIIGRSHTAAVVLDDPRVSVAHAMLDVRSGRASLIRLRRALYVDGVEASSVTLKPGIRIGLSPDPDLTLTVDTVQIPTHVLTLEGLLSHPIDLYSDLAVLPAHDRSRPFTVQARRYTPAALAHIYPGDGTWKIHVRGTSPEPLFDGWQGQLAGVPLRVRARLLADDDQLDTMATAQRIRITARYESVTIDDGTPRRPIVISGFPARILSEVIECGGGPIPKRDIAEQIWNSPTDRDLDEHTLCARLDRHLGILRTKLQTAGLPPDLLSRNGKGLLELKLGPHDTARIDDTPGAIPIDLGRFPP
ncbi:MAG TPA: FHA domain-containing protein [Nannocystaceae bacterium]|nr:FHA domain-containing protein [Nannocystaceae bacterium]